jgi:hypothetical protein
MHPSLIRDRTTENRLVEHLFFPRNTLATLVMSDSEPEQLLRREQARNKSAVIKSQAGDVTDDTEYRVVIEIKRVCFPAERIRIRKK